MEREANPRNETMEVDVCQRDEAMERKPKTTCTQANEFDDLGVLSDYEFGEPNQDVIIISNRIL